MSTEVESIGAAVNASQSLTAAIIAEGILRPHDVETHSLGSLQGATSGDAPSFVAFFGKLVSDHQVDDTADNRGKLLQFLSLLRAAAEDSKKRMLASTGVGGTGGAVPRTRVEFLGLCAAVGDAIRVRIPPEAVLAESLFNKIWCEIRDSGQVHTILSDFSAPNDAKSKTEKSTSFGESFRVVHEEVEGEEAMRIGVIIQQLMRFMITLMAAGGVEVAPVPGNPQAFTKGEYGKVSEQGRDYYMYCDWPELFQYFMMMVGVSSALPPTDLKALHVWYMRQVNENMRNTGNNVSSALMFVMSQTPATAGMLAARPYVDKVPAEKSGAGKGGSGKGGKGAAASREDSKEVSTYRRGQGPVRDDRRHDDHRRDDPRRGEHRRDDHRRDDRWSGEREKGYRSRGDERRQGR